MFNKATIYVPIPGSMIFKTVMPGSAIVGKPAHGMEGLILYYEGNRYDAINLRRYDERVKCAAGRLFERYPTIAKTFVGQDDVKSSLCAVGQISGSYQIEIDKPKQLEAYLAPIGATLKTDDGFVLAKREDGSWSDGDLSFGDLSALGSNFRLVSGV